MPSSEVQNTISELNRELSGQEPEALIRAIAAKYGQKLAFATSLGAEDQVITHMLAGLDEEVNIFTLDTGRLFPETLDLIDKTNKRYGLNIRVYFPDAQKVEKMVHEKGINLFYESIENRRECCNIRKILPMKRALEGSEAWISGLRSEQSVTRRDLDLVEWDSNFSLIKISPLKDWTEDELWKYIRKHDIPYNPLHDKGFPSIGCLPCTRAIAPGEDIRAGRWWWELPENKECGLHQKS